MIHFLGFRSFLERCLEFRINTPFFSSSHILSEFHPTFIQLCSNLWPWVFLNWNCHLSRSEPFLRRQGRIPDCQHRWAASHEKHLDKGKVEPSPRRANGDDPTALFCPRWQLCFFIRGQLCCVRIFVLFVNMKIHCLNPPLETGTVTIRREHNWREDHRTCPIQTWSQCQQLRQRFG